MNIIIVAVFVIFSILNFYVSAEIVVCYYASWAKYRPGAGRFTVDDINPKICTHVNYAFIGLNEDATIKILDDSDKDSFKRFVNLKQRNSNLKLLVSIGGWSEGGQKFSHVVSSDSLRTKFVKNALAFLKEYKFDGLDLDWEYPGEPTRGGNEKDLPNFTKLIKELKNAFAPNNLLLTAAVASTANEITKYYQVPELSKYLDFINVMDYDFHSSSEGRTGQNAPLYKSHIDTNPTLNVKSSIEAWIKMGANPKKLILGMGMYGKSYQLKNKDNHELGAPTSGPGNAGPYGQEKGTLGYNEIVEKIKDNKLTVVWDDEQKVPYGYYSNQWVGYDNEKSIKIKCQFAKEKSLGGAMVWSIDTDDFKGVSGKTFALLKTINGEFGRSI